PSRPSRHSFPTRRSSDLRRQGETRAKAIVRPPTPLRGAESDRQVAGDDGAARSPGQPAGSKPPVPGEEREEEYGHAHCGSDLVDSYLGLTLCYVAFSLPIVVWLMRDFFEAIPIEVEEAAMVDNVPSWRIFLGIVVPMSM